MIIRDNRAPMTKFEFNDIEVGAVFTVEGSPFIYMKLPNLVHEEDEERVNAINLNNNEVEEIGLREWCMPVQAELTISFYNV